MYETGIGEAIIYSRILQGVKNSQYEFLVSILTGFLCRQFYDPSLVLCRFYDTGFRRNGSTASHHYNITSSGSLESSHTQETSNYGIQSHTNSIFREFLVWYLKCMRQALEKQLYIVESYKEGRTVSMSF